MLATEYAGLFGIGAQAQDESDYAFKHRVALGLRAQGHIIEAHEAESDARFDDGGGDAMTGIFGAVAQAMQGVSYRGDAVDNDVAAGVVVRHPKDDTATLMATMLMMLG